MLLVHRTTPIQDVYIIHDDLFLRKKNKQIPVFFTFCFLLFFVSCPESSKIIYMEQRTSHNL